MSQCLYEDVSDEDILSESEKHYKIVALPLYILRVGSKLSGQFTPGSIAEKEKQYGVRRLSVPPNSQKFRFTEKMIGVKGENRTIVFTPRDFDYPKYYPPYTPQTINHFHRQQSMSSPYGMVWRVGQPRKKASITSKKRVPSGLYEIVMRLRLDSTKAIFRLKVRLDSQREDTLFEYHYLEKSYASYTLQKIVPFNSNANMEPSYDKDNKRVIRPPRYYFSCITVGQLQLLKETCTTFTLEAEDAKALSFDYLELRPLPVSKTVANILHQATPNLPHVIINHILSFIDTATAVHEQNTSRT